MTFSFPTALNPFQTRTPVSKLGKFGRAINPLNPRNLVKSINPLNPTTLATALLTEAVLAVTGKVLPEEAQNRVRYFTFGPQAGLALNILDAGRAGASDRDEAALIKKYSQSSPNREIVPVRPAAPIERSIVPGAPTSTTFVAPTTGRQDTAQYVPPRSEPRSVPVPATATATPPVEEVNELAMEYTKQGLLGKAMAKGGELQRRLFEAGGGAGMTSENFMSFVEANPAIAYREMLRREAMMQENEALV